MVFATARTDVQIRRLQTNSTHVGVYIHIVLYHVEGIDWFFADTMKIHDALSPDESLTMKREKRKNKMVIRIKSENV